MLKSYNRSIISVSFPVVHIANCKSYSRSQYFSDRLLDHWNTCRPSRIWGNEIEFTNCHQRRRDWRGKMKKMEQFPAKNPNPVISVEKNGTVLYSNGAGEPLLHEWGVWVGEKLPSDIADVVQRVISWNSPEKMEVKVRNRVYYVALIWYLL